MGAPKCISDWFDIQAKASGNASEDQLRLMAQTLLAERFQLKVQHQTRELPVYALVAGKNGAKLQVAKDNGRPRGADRMSRGLRSLEKSGLGLGAATPDSRPSIFTAVQEQLGLKRASY